MKIWIESSKNKNFTVQNYVEEPAINNDALGTVTQYFNEKVFWTTDTKSGYVDTIEEGK